MGQWVTWRLANCRGNFALKIYQRDPPSSWKGSGGPIFQLSILKFSEVSNPPDGDIGRNGGGFHFWKDFAKKENGLEL